MSKYKNFLYLKNGQSRYSALECGHEVAQHDIKNCMKCVVSKGTRTGVLASRWKGGRQINSDGYVILRVGKRRIHEHRLIASRALGRNLKSHEHVHHVNGDKADNRNGNLLICSRSYHSWLEGQYAQRYARLVFPSRID